jgi:hypothetical protein
VADDLAPDELRRVQQQFAALGVEEFVVSAASTLATLAYAKLDAGNLPEAKQAIDALQSLVPHVGGDLGRELQNALTGLQLAFVQVGSE